MKNGKIMMNVDFHKVIDDCVKKSGIELWGFCPFSDSMPLKECRAKARLPEFSETVIVCAFPYMVKESGRRNLSYYACVKDYHIVVEEILEKLSLELKNKTGYQFEAFVDNSPIREVEVAVKSGIGVLGDNGLLITEKYGSYVFIGEIVTDLKLESEIFSRSCMHCGMCMKKCPTGALSNGKVNETLCISSISQKKGELSEVEKNLIKEGGLVWGCDTCQTVCPMNKNVKETYISDFINSAHHFLKSDEIDERIKESAYNWRGKKTIQRNVNLFNKQ